jgi:DNA modification methylase
MTNKPPQPARGTRKPQTSDAAPRWRVEHADCRELLARLPAGCVDAVITDPPYGIDFHGCRWDGQTIRKETGARTLRRTAAESFQAWSVTWASECLRVMRPGAHLAAFGAPRTAHRLACALEDAGLELRDTLMWLYGTGIPKSRRLAGGQATGLKPAYEPILLARKPLDGTVERNVARHRTGALNASACRVGGRFPANLVLTHHPNCRTGACASRCPAAILDAAAGPRRVGSLHGPSRLFYCPKAARRERNAGCEHLPERPLDLFPRAGRSTTRPRPAPNDHPTVKPIALMRWLVRLLAPEGGLVLDPFCGSGSTGCAAVAEDRRFLGVDRDSHYIEVAHARITHWATLADTERQEEAA